MEKKAFNRDEVMKLLKYGRKEAVLEYDLRDADLQDADLQGANLRGAYLQDADLQGANLRDADLQGAYLRGAYLQGANLRGTYLQGADLQGANLRGADLDFSCLPLRCGGLNWNIDKRLACQLAYHLCTMQCEDEEFIEIRNHILTFANQFHRVGECGRLEKINKHEAEEEEQDVSL